jgi:aspartate dehydrogenase
MKTIAILGCGNIGRIVAGQAENVRFVGVFDQDEDRCRDVASLCGATACKSFDALMALDFNLLVEAASVEAVRAFAPRVIEAGRDLVVLSVGALADADLRAQLEDLAQVSGARLRVPSGAVIGLDNLKVGRISRLDRLLLKTTKPPAALGVEVEQPTCLFRGSASESIKQFPRNINVAVSLSLAADRECEVEIWADPQATGNRHQVIFEGEFGRAELTIDNVPSPGNPRTSYLAALSVLALIEDENRHIRVGS